MYGALIDRECFVLFIANLAVVTHPLRGGWITEIRAVSYADNRGEQTCKSTYSCRFACASTSTDKDTPYRWIDGVENEGKSHVLLPNYSTQRECCHVHAFVDYSTLCWLRRSCASLRMTPYDKIHAYCMLSHAIVHFQHEFQSRSIDSLI